MATREFCPIEYNGSKSGYIRHGIDCEKVDQPAGSIVTQLIGNKIDYRVWNGDYQRSLLTPLSETGDPSIDAPINKNPIQPKLLNGYNEDYLKEGTGGFSQKYVEQTIYEKWIIDENNPGNLIDGVNQILISQSAYDKYVKREFCGQEINFSVKNEGSLITPIGDIILSMEEDRDDTFYTEDAHYVIELEVNTTLSHIDYENDYFVREEGDIALSYENGYLIEPS